MHTSREAAMSVVQQTAPAPLAAGGTAPVATPMKPTMAEGGPGSITRSGSLVSGLQGSCGGLTDSSPVSLSA
jgi:hypothetical protein